MITTHYPELKVYGYDRTKTINASMEFDQSDPAADLPVAVGDSRTVKRFEIAKRLGIGPGNHQRKGPIAGQ